MEAKWPKVRTKRTSIIDKITYTLTIQKSNNGANLHPLNFFKIIMEWPLSNQTEKSTFLAVYKMASTLTET